MLKNLVRVSRFTTKAAAALSLLALPLAAHAAVEIDPGDTESALAADGGKVLEQCATTPDETCTVSINTAFNEVGARVDAEANGAGVARGEIFTDFSISNDSEAALIGSFVSGQVDVDGRLEAFAANAMASVDVSLQVTDMTAGVLVGAQTVLSHTVVNGSLPVAHSKAVVVPLPLTRGHDYRISLIIAARAEGSVSEAIGALSDFVGTASWLGLSVTAGQDPFEPLAELEALVDRIANALRDLQKTVAELREDFESHTHTYLTGRGQGHNNTEATTTSPSDGDVTPEASDAGNSQGGSPGATNSSSSSSSQPEPSEDDSGTQTRRRRR
jgi:hypothetical protein